MSSTTARDDLKIPKVDTTGKNWSTWKVKLEHALGMKRLKGYLNGMVLMLTHPAEQHLPAWIPTTIAEELEVADYERAFESWDEKDCMVKHYIGSSIPDTLFIHLHSKTMGIEYFEALCEQFKNRSIAISIEKQCQLGELKLKDGGVVVFV
ncbi:hypothetical protein BS17DRAFT_575503 [Gyrodon lividus]|nr:hypothetical protein BS17DRAFT_575503 [Gyrodon lividus]